MFSLSTSHPARFSVSTSAQGHQHRIPEMIMTILILGNDLPRIGGREVYGNERVQISPCKRLEWRGTDTSVCKLSDAPWNH
jgi:hypothetical protein